MQQSISQAQQQDIAEYEELKSAYAQWGKELSYEEYVNIKLQAYNVNNSDSKNNSYGIESGGFNYKEMYTRYENVVKSYFGNLSSAGTYTDKSGNINGETNLDMKSSAYVQNKMGLRDAQNEMRRIRIEAEKAGVYIQQSQWETANAGY